jgi:uncharacterized membrane protein YbhN (UPF0104 family)
VNKRTLINIAKYVLAASLLAWVVYANWAPPPTKASTTLGASTVGLCATPGGHGPLLAASAAVPGRLDSHGLGYVYERHIVQGQPIRTGFLIGGFVLYCLAAALTMVRWYLLVRALDLHLTLRDAFRFGLIGVFFNSFLPGAVGGDIIKAAVLARGQSRRTAAVATVIMDRLIALWGLVWFVAILGSIFWATGMLEGPAATTAAYIVTGALILVAVTAAGWLGIGLLADWRAERFAGRLSRLPLVGGSAGEFWRAAWMYRRRQGSVAIALGLTWIGQIGFVSAFYCCANALWSPELGPVPTLTQHFLLVPLGLVMQALVPTPGGAGGGEWGFAALFLLFRAAEANGVLGSLVQRIFSWLLGLVGYLVYLWTKPALPASLPATEGEQQRGSDQTLGLPAAARIAPAT